MIDGRFRLVEPIGSGAMGEVWRGVHISLDRTVAIKLVAVTERRDGDERLARFVREAKAAARIESPHVVRVFDHGVHEGSGFIAMELLVGESLRQRLGRIAPAGTDPARLSEVARIASQAGAAMTKAHSVGVLHRDVKPDNIYIANVDGREVVKILDFGVAKITDLEATDASRTREGVMVGTPSYMSPEQITAGGAVDSRSDLWQLAIVVFECVTGRLPVASDTVGELLVKVASADLPAPSEVSAVPEGFDAWFARATAPLPEDRFPSADMMAEALCRVLTPTIAHAEHVRARPAWPEGAPRSKEHGVPLTLEALETSTGRGWTTAMHAGSGRRTMVLAAVVGAVVVLGGVALIVALQGPAALPEPAAPAESEQPAPDPPVPTAVTSEPAPAPSAEAPAASVSASSSAPRPPWPARRAPTSRRPEDVLGI